MIYIDPSELREQSNLKKYLDAITYQTLPDLEAQTGADLMIAPTGLPVPLNDKLLKLNVEKGAKLIQLKFGHDIASSIVDGRLNEALSRMLKLGAMPWQALLLFIGIFSYDQTQGMATINGQLSYTEPPMTWKGVQAALTFWTERGGGLDFPLASGRLIGDHLAIHQAHLDRFAGGEDTKLIWPAKPAFYDELGGDFVSEWQAAQKIKLVDDLRVLLCAIPDAKIGPERATAIVNYMTENNVRADFRGFLDMLESEDILEVSGIGKGILSKILWGLWRTKEEREARDAK